LNLLLAQVPVVAIKQAPVSRNLELPTKAA